MFHDVQYSGIRLLFSPNHLSIVQVTWYKEGSLVTATGSPATHPRWIFLIKKLQEPYTTYTVPFLEMIVNHREVPLPEFSE
jgi:hypothetical protein